MPVEESTDIDLGTNEKTFDELDRAAAKAIKTLETRNKELKKSISTASKAEREQKRLEKREGIFAEKEGILPSGAAPRDIAQLSKQDQKIEKRMRKLEEKVRKDEVRQLGDKETILDKILGKRAASNIISMGKNPRNFFFGIAKTLPWLGGVFAAKEIADFIIDEIVKLDKFLKAFIDEVDNRIDAFRTLQEQANVQAGLTQRIITTASGSTEPRYAYNTFEEFNNNQISLEEKFQMTNNSGVE